MGAKALQGLGWLYYAQGDHATARSHLEESVALSREVGDMAVLGHSLGFLSQVVLGLGDLSRARSLAEEGLALLREAGAQWELGIAFTNLGNVVRAQ